MIVELDHSERWVAATVCLMGGTARTTDVIAGAREWLEASVGELHALPPLSVIIDVGQVLTRAPFDTSLGPRIHDDELRTARQKYLEYFIGHLRSDLRLQEVCDAVVRLPEPVRASAVAVFLAQILDESSSLGVVVRAAEVRRQLRRPAAELIDFGVKTLQEDDMLDLLTEQYNSLASLGRRTGALIREATLFVLSNLEALRAPSDRLALSQIAEASEVVSSKLPRRIRKVVESTGHAATHIEVENTYPVGGYASIATYGSIENLVSSELVYMEENADVDLFDLRYAANELLKFTRDESVHVRERRTIVFALTPELQGARVKDPGVEWQRLVLLLGCILAGVQRLIGWLDEQELKIVLMFFVNDESDPLRKERALFQLLLREPIESGVVELQECSELWPQSREPDEGRLDFVRIGFTGFGLETEGVRCFELLVSNPAPRLEGPQLSHREPQRIGLDGWVRPWTSLLESLL